MWDKWKLKPSYISDYFFYFFFFCGEDVKIIIG